MPVTSVTTDEQALTLTIVADFPVPLRRLWGAYTDPRQIARFWGPPGYPATFTRHDVVPGGRSHYYMTGPDGDHSPGFWEWISVDAPNHFTVRDGFATDDDGTPDTPASRVTTVTTFNSLEELEKLTAMGMIEGTRAAMGQIDAVLAEV